MLVLLMLDACKDEVYLHRRKNIKKLKGSLLIKIAEAKPKDAAFQVY